MFSQLAILADMLQSLTCYLLRWDVMSMLLYLSLLGIFIETYSLSTWQGGHVLGLGPCVPELASTHGAWALTLTRALSPDQAVARAPWYLAWHWHSHNRPRIQTVSPDNNIRS